jgi:mono/diheme cytochrome c family protein
MKIVAAAAVLFLTVSPAVLAAGDVAAGKTSFHNHCAVCHGDDGLANTPMAKAFNADMDLHDAKATALKDADIETIIKNGTGKMPKPPGVTDDEIPNLIAYIRSLQTKK